MKTRILALALSCGLLATSNTTAATALIDLSRAAEPPVPGVDGKYWNPIGNGSQDDTITGLIDLGNNLTGFDLTIDVTNVQSGGVSGAGFGGTAINGPAGPDPFDEPNAITDGVFANNDDNGTAVFAFTGLVGGATYDFSAIGGRENNGEDGQIIILPNSTPIGNGSPGSLTTYQLSNLGNVLDFSADATPSGEIWFEFRKEGGNVPSTGATFNALSITGPVIPEPSTALLGGLGLSLLLLRRKR